MKPFFRPLTATFALLLGGVACAPEKPVPTLIDVGKKYGPFRTAVDVAGKKPTFQEIEKPVGLDEITGV